MFCSTIIADDTDERQTRGGTLHRDQRQAAMANGEGGGHGLLARVLQKDLAVQTSWRSPYVAGSYQTVSKLSRWLAENGIAGVCFIFPDYEERPATRGRRVCR